MVKKLVSILSRYYPIIVFLTLIIFIGFSQPCFANPIDPNNPYRFNYKANLFLWLSCPFIEAAIIVFFLRHKFVRWESFVVPIILIILLNWITIPFTWFFAEELLENTQNVYYFYLAEIFPLLTESIVLILLFKYILKKSFSEPIRIEIILLLELIANLVTLLIGLGFFNLHPAPLNLK